MFLTSNIKAHASHKIFRPKIHNDIILQYFVSFTIILPAKFSAPFLLPLSDSLYFRNVTFQYGRNVCNKELFILWFDFTEL
jgi:hypothetical protein